MCASHSGPVPETWTLLIALIFHFSSTYSSSVGCGVCREVNSIPVASCTHPFTSMTPVEKRMTSWSLCPKYVLVSIKHHSRFLMRRPQTTVSCQERDDAALEIIAVLQLHHHYKRRSVFLRRGPTKMAAEWSRSGSLHTQLLAESKLTSRHFSQCHTGKQK